MLAPPEKLSVGRQRRALVADLFCGAGSLSAGANDALIELGYAPQFVAVNHWNIATQTYARNHPGARVHCVTLDAASPMHLVPEGRLDLLMAGVECTYFSRARGGKPVTDQQRMSGWHVVRWCTELRIKRLLIENVPEWVRWGPVDRRTGRPVKSREGEYFRAWWTALENVGFRLDMRVINCADNGDATTRERLFILGRSDGKRITWPAPSHTRRADLFGAEPWRAARDCIDWSIRGASIFDRKRPLAPKTLARIAAGIVKFGWPKSFIVVLKQHCDARGIELPLSTIHAGGTHFGLVEPFILNRHGDNGGHCRASSVEDPAPTVTGAGGGYVLEPFIATVAHGNDARERDPDSRRCRSLDQPLQTIHAGGGKFGIIAPFVLSQHAGGAPRSADQPLPGITNDGAHALIAPYYGSGSGETCRSVEDPLPAATTKARFGLVIPVMHQDRSNRARSVDQPLPTLTTAKRGELAFIAASFGERADQAPRVHSLDEPAPTICASGHTNLVHGVEGVREYDILFRMLDPSELAAAMSISTPDQPYHFSGTKTEIVRQIGQAVPRRTGRALARELMRT